MKKAPTEWTHEQKTLIDWFLSEKHLPCGPYTLRQGTTVVNHITFYARLKSEIEAGPGFVRAQMGGLFDDLRCLREIIQDWSWP